MPLVKERLYTVEDIEALPEGQRAELIDGVMYDMSAPTSAHQILSNLISYHITNYVLHNNGACRVVPAPFAVYLNKDNTNYVQPDISVICDPNKISSRGGEGAPDWIIEIVSPTSVKMDYSIKLFKYRTAGVREYWIVDYIERQVVVYNFENNDEYQKYSFSDCVPVGIYNGDLQIDFSTLNL